MEEYKYWFSTEIEDINYSNLGGFIREKIEKSERLDEYVKSILMNYPVVYLHLWKNENGEEMLYIGETIDLARRMDEHEKTGESKDKSWQNKWQNSKEKKSWFFSSPEMNKSLALDIEDYLMKCFDCVNRRDNPQTNYSNKKKCGELLKQIINVLCKELNLSQKPYSSESNTYCEYNNDDLVLYHKGFQMDEKYNEDGIVFTSDVNSYLFNQYPIVYFHLWEDQKNNIHTYTGESNDLKRRTEQHEEFFDIADLNDENWHNSWQNSKNKIMLVFGHREMNASITKDIEDLLIVYTRALGISVNGRRNPQRDYNKRSEMYPLFCRIISILNKINGNVFKSLDQLKEESAFLASPLIQLSKEQSDAKKEIIETIVERLNQNKEKCHILIVSGSAGTGKTVITSSIFFDLCERGINTRLIVNNKELIKTYSMQSDVRSLSTSGEKLDAVSGADQYIKDTKKSDVVLVDEAHLLFSKSFMNTIKKSQLQELADNCKILVLMIDPDQYVKRATMWEDDLTSDNMEERFQSLFLEKATVKYILNLTKQFRMNCSKTTADWIKNILTEDAGEIASFPYKSGNYSYRKYDKGEISFHEVIEKNEDDESIYEIRIYNTWEALAKDIEELKGQNNPSSLIASYCWKQECNTPDNPMLSTKDGYKLFWHKTGYGKNSRNNGIWTLGNTMKVQDDEKAFEVGSFHDIQGFDLNYAGVILGKSIIYDCSAKCIRYSLGRRSKKEEGRRDLKESDKWQTLIKNEIGVLLTRGMKGLYIYAVDEGIRNKLIKAIIKKE